MRLMRLFTLMTVAVVCVAPLPAQTAAPAQQNIGPEKEQAIRRLLAVAGTSKLMGQMMGQMMASLRTGFPDVPPRVWARLGARMKSGDLIALLIPVYDKYYTTEDINGLLAFYQTPLGQKVLATMPQISRESMTIGQEWGRKQAQSVIRELQQEEKASTKHSKLKITDRITPESSVWSIMSTR